MAFGFYGKLPSQGDFVTRRLPWEFTQAWDAWMQAGMRAVREQQGEAWLERYLSAPVWRFRLAPGLAGPSAWAGLWFASVDRVGRHFPLCFARPLPAADTPAAAAGLVAQGEDATWRNLEDLALMALDPRLSVAQLDELSLAWELPALPPPPPPSFAQVPGLRALGPEASVDDARRACQTLSGAPALFFTWGSDSLPPLLLAADGWPGPDDFSALLGHVPGLAAQASAAPPTEPAASSAPTRPELARPPADATAAPAPQELPAASVATAPPAAAPETESAQAHLQVDTAEGPAP